MKIQNNNFYSQVILQLTVLISCFFMVSCANEQIVKAQDGLTISHIEVKTIGATDKSRPNMAKICKGFIISRSQVQTFFQYSSHARNINSYKNYNILPCFSSGTALIDNKPFNWIIRSGGVGEFYNQHRHFLKICGKNCCDKVSGVC